MIRKFYEADFGGSIGFERVSDNPSQPSGGKSAENVLKKHIPNYNIDHYAWSVRLRWDMADNISQLILAAMEEYASQYAHQQPPYELDNGMGTKTTYDTSKQPVHGYSREQMEECFAEGVNAGMLLSDLPTPRTRFTEFMASQQHVNDGWEGAHNIDDTEPPKQ